MSYVQWSDLAHYPVKSNPIVWLRSLQRDPDIEQLCVLRLVSKAAWKSATRVLSQTHRFHLRIADSSMSARLHTITQPINNSSVEKLAATIKHLLFDFTEMDSRRRKFENDHRKENTAEETSRHENLSSLREQPSYEPNFLSVLLFDPADSAITRCEEMIQQLPIFISECLSYPRSK